VLSGLILLAGATGSALAGYSVEEAILRDAERAIPGFLHGLLLFGLAAIGSFLMFRGKHVSLLGSWIFLFIVAWLLVFGIALTFTD